MKRQTDLLGFFKAADKKLEISAPKFSSSQGANQFSSDDQAENVSGLTDTSIIGDTPNASRVCNVLQNTLSSPTFPVNKSDLDASKQLPTLQKRRGPAHRRSSLTVRRQAELLEKYQSALDFDGGPSNETAVERESRQANASAKLRRGKYDSLNYAPVDQITVSPISRSSSLPGEQRAFSHRSETLVNRALQASAKPRRPFSEITETLKADETLIKRLKPLVDQPKRCPPEAFSSPTFVENDKKTLTPSGLNNLNSEEMGALNEIMNLLEDDSASPKPVTTLTSRKIISKIKRRKIKPSINAVESPGIQKAQTTQFVKNISLTNSALDDSLTQLNLSNWSMNDSFGEFNTDRQGDAISSIETVPLADTELYRGQITGIEKSRDHIMLKMGLEDSVPTNRETSASLEVILTDSWAEEDFTLGDTIQIVPGVGLSIHGRQITISDSPGFSKSEQGLENHIPALLIQYPDFLVPCTKLVGSLYCTRRSVIEQFWPAGDSAPESVSVAKDGSNQTHPGFVMLLGSLLHELFQQLINLRHPTVEDGKAFVQSMVTRADFILQAYVCGTKVADLRMVLFEKIKTILNWIEVHRRIDLTPRSSTVRKPVVHEVLDIEENIWSTRFGLKGKIDLSALCAAPTPSFGKTQTVPSDDSIVLSLVPIELKTGRPTYSVEHKGQVLLYLLMLFDRYGSHYKFARKKNVQTARFGWLVYLQDPQSSVTAASDPGLIEPKMSEFRGLIQTRNRIAAHLMRVTGANLDSPHQGTSSSLPWKPELPEPTKRLHTCKMCPVQLACSLLSARNDSIHNDCSSKSATMITEITSVSELLTTKRTHLTTDHVSFFLRWSRLILLELADTDRLENVVRQIVIGHRWKKSTDHETRLTVRALRAIHGMKNPANGQWITLFTSCTPDVESPSQPGDFDPAPGDFVIVSSHDRNNVGVALGTILSPEEITDTHISSRPEFRNSRNPILLSTDGPLPKWIDSFRLDRYVTSKGTQLNLSNMVNLMEDSELSAYLRRLIVNRNEPTFSSTLSKRTVQDIRTFLKPMNMDQRAAILRVLMANDYVLIQGYPGTGKTQTLTTLLKVLILLGRKTLVVAHTHSAVDNLLGRLIQSGEKRVLRLGSADRIRPDLLDFCFEKILTNSSSNSDTEDAVDRCQRLIDEAVVVGCSALAASGGQGARHAALCRIQFDTVVIDEATQLLLPTAIGSLFCLRPKPTVPGARFVLVGDPYQLPPLVQSSRARHAGYECSLFSHLLNRKDSCPLDRRTSNVVLSDSSTVSSLAKNPALVELTLQYRMNRRILLLSNQLTYSHAIRSANTKISEASLADVLRPNDSEMTHSWTKRVYSTDVTDSVIFLDTHLWNCCSPHSKSGTHFQNRTEAGLVVWILSGFFRFELKAADVGVIAPHRKQVALIRELLANSPSRPDESRLVEVNTVDQFQGRDKRLIVLSLTTCSGATVSDGSFDQNQRSTTGRLGLLDSLPRLTVALTRAKHKLLLIGCPGTCDAFAPKHATESVRDSDKRSLDKLFTLLERISATETLPVASRTILDT